VMMARARSRGGILSLAILPIALGNRVAAAPQRYLLVAKDP